MRWSVQATFASGRQVFLSSSTRPGKQNPCTGTAFCPSLSSSSLSLNSDRLTCSRGPITKPMCWGATAVVQINDVVFFAGSKGSTIFLRQSESRWKTRNSIPHPSCLQNRLPIDLVLCFLHWTPNRHPHRSSYHDHRPSRWLEHCWAVLWYR